MILKLNQQQYVNIFRNFLRSKWKMWGFKSADAEALKRKRTYSIIVFKDKLKTLELTPELKTYYKLYLCIKPNDNISKIAARIRSHIIVFTSIILSMYTQDLHLSFKFQTAPVNYSSFRTN